MDDVDPHSASRTDTDYSTALGYLQIGTGSLTLLMSFMAFCQWALGHGEMLNLGEVFGLSSGLLDRAISAYVSLQLSLGWIAGGLQLAAGACCLSGRRQRFVGVASLVSLLNFPHGTMAAILTLNGLYQGAIRPRVAAESPL
jgi:hypothetical protein